MSIWKKIGAFAMLFGGAVMMKILTGDDREPEKYSPEWFKSKSSDELDTERESVRQRYCNSGDDYEAAVRAEKELDIIDRERRKRTGSNYDDYGYPSRTEHGWYLPEDDD